MDINKFHRFVEDPKLLKSWKVLNELPQDIRTKFLNLEVAKRLDGVKLHPTHQIENDKLIKQVIEGIDQIGDNGTYILNKIKGGNFEDISGYSSLIKAIKKDGGVTNAGNVAHEVRQTFQKLDADVSIPNSRKVLGDGGPTTNYDIDYGVKSISGTPKYVDAYQFKIKNANKIVQKTMNLNEVKKQLLNADAQNKILQVGIREGSGALDDVVGSSNFTSKLNALKQEIPGFKLIITDHLGGVLDIF